MTDVVAVPVPSAGRPRRPSGLLRAVFSHTTGRIGLIMLGFYAVVVVAGPFLVSGSPSADFEYQNLAHALEGPSREHWLGTDAMGRDELVRLVLGARYTVIIALIAVAAGFVIGVTIGAVSGYFGGWIDALVQRFVDIVLAFPHFLLALALVAASGPGVRNLMIALAITSFPRYARLVRATSLSVRELPYVEAARSLGVASPRILVRHIVPNSLTPALAQSPLELASSILTAAGLGFLGLGVQEPTPEWGSMLGGARDFMFTAPTLVTYPGLCIMGIILAANLVGDGLRDVLDPRLRLKTGAGL